MYKFEFILTEADYVDFFKFHAEQSWINRKTSPFLRWFVPALFVGTFLLVLPGIDNWLTAVVHGIIIAVFSIVWLVFEKRISRAINHGVMKLSIYASKKEGKLPFGKTTQITFCDEAIREINEISETKVKYSSVERVIKGPKAVYIYVSATQATVLPLSIFESEEQVEELMAFVTERQKATI